MPPLAAAIAAAQAAVDAEPGSIGLRLHLSTLLLDAGSPAESLPHLEVVLNEDGANVEALLQATRACEALGEVARAREYRSLATALSTRGPARASAPGGAADPGAGHNPRLTLADVAGMDHVKQRLQVSFLGRLRQPEVRAAYDNAARGGLLLFGAASCGKTLIGHAVAGELGARFIPVAVPEVAAAPPGSNQELGAVFAVARVHRPAVVFLDQLEAIGPGDELGRRLMAEMDREGNEGVFTLGASEAPWQVTPELLGPGYFDRPILVLPPDRAARMAILRRHLEGHQADGLDVEAAANDLDGYSVVDIAEICRAAIALAGAAVPPSKVRRSDLDAARGGIPRSTRKWFEAARNAAVFASPNGMYDDLMTYMRSRRMV
jgi:hypothetical protein